MSTVNLENMLARFERALERPNPPPTLLKDYVLPCLQEITVQVAQNGARLSEVEDLVDAVGDKADMAFITARETLAGELFNAVAVNIEVIRTGLLRLGLPETDVLVVACGNIESAVFTYTEHLAEDDEDEEEGGEAGDGGEGEEEEGGAVPPGDEPPVSILPGVTPEASAADPTVTDVAAEASTDGSSEPTP
jgi:hypothetical protein